MGLPIKIQIQWWSITVAVFLFFMIVLGNVILPFILGAAIAYLLDPVVDALESRKISRGLAVTLISLPALLIVVLLVILIVPALLQQLLALITFISNLIERAPELMQHFDTVFGKLLPFLKNTDVSLSGQMLSLTGSFDTEGFSMLGGLLGSARSLLDLLVLCGFTPIVAVYLLYDWDNIITAIDNLLPRDHLHTIRTLARDIDKTLASFVRGQGAVCLILGAFYAICLMTLGLQLGLIAGAVAGLLSFIPFVGALIGGGLSIGLALFQYWNGIEIIGPDGAPVYQTDWLRIGAVAAVFFAGQFLEGNFVTPRLVGNSVGLHPLWLIFALSAFGSLFGFVGMLVAVPTAAVIGVIVRFSLQSYQQSRLYRGFSSLQNDDLKKGTNDTADV